MSSATVDDEGGENPAVGRTSPIFMEGEVLPVDETAVRVAVRARPLIAKEIMEHSKECITFLPQQRQIIVGKERCFTFDYVFTPTAKQEEVFVGCVRSLVDQCISGYNATVLAYGQTGSGKTHTMGSAGNISLLLEEELGILPRVISHLFESIEARKAQAEFLVKCSFVEIYNEEVKDLLHPDTPAKLISIREDTHGDIILAGVREEVVPGFEDMVRWLEQGSVSRTVGSTLMNEASSRSHAIFTIHLEQRTLSDGADSEVITSKFHLVDLAGSERNKKTGAVGLRFKESVTINCGLLALGNVISALGDERKRGSHVPYRESKLTRMLQDSLGGNSRTCMIACISTAECNFEETLNSLKYANRARNIRNKPVINRDPQAAQFNIMRQEIQALQLEIVKLRSNQMGVEVQGPSSPEDLLKDEATQAYFSHLRGSAGMGQSSGLMQELQVVRERALKAHQDCVRLQEQLQKSHAQAAKLSEETLELRTERDHYQLRLDEVTAEIRELLEKCLVWQRKGELSEVLQHELHHLSRLVESGAEDMLRCSAEEANGACASESARSSVLQEASQRDSVCVSVDGDSALRGSAGTRNIINQHLRAIRALEDKLAAKESEIKEKDDALAEATEDLARDELIFAEKMKEIKALKKLARELTREKEALLEQKGKDAEKITQLSNAARTQEEENRQLQIVVAEARGGRVTPIGGEAAAAWVGGGGTQADSMEGRGLVPPEWDDTVGELQSQQLRDEEEEERSEEEALVSQLEAETMRLQEKTAAQERDFQRAKQLMDKQLRELTFNIKQKEELIQDLARNEQEAKMLTQHYEARMHDLQAEMQRKEAEVEELRLELEAIDKSAAKGIEEKRRLRLEYEDKLKRVNAQLSTLKKQHKEQESQRVERLKAKTDQKVQQLEGEITRMRAQQDNLRRKIKETDRSWQETQDLHAREMASLKRDADTHQRRVRELESENEKQRMVLRRKTEEMAAANKKLKELGMHDFDGASKLSNRERAHAYDHLQRTSTPRSKRMSGSYSTEPSPRSTGKSSLDLEIERMVKARQAMVRKEQQEMRRKAIAAERDQIAEQRSRLELKAARAAQLMARQAEGAVAAISRLKEQLHAVQSRAEAAEAAGDTKDAETLMEQAAHLHDQLRHHTEAFAALQTRQRSNQYLSEEEAAEMTEMDERLEGLDEQAEYVANTIADVQHEIAEAQAAHDAFRAQVDSLPLTDAKSMLRRYVERVVEAIGREEVAGGRSRELELQLQEKSRALDELETSIHLKEMEFDRRVTELQKQEAQRVQHILREFGSKSHNSIHMAKVDSPAISVRSEGERGRKEDGEEIGTAGEREDGVEATGRTGEHLASLEKDNLYYKQMNRELKRKLRELTTLRDAERVDSQRTIQSLQEENSNTRQLLTRAGLHASLPAKDLRPLTPSELHLRASAQGPLTASPSVPFLPT